MKLKIAKVKARLTQVEQKEGIGISSLEAQTIQNMPSRSLILEQVLKTFLPSMKDKR